MARSRIFEDRQWGENRGSGLLHEGGRGEMRPSPRIGDHHLGGRATKEEAPRKVKAGGTTLARDVPTGVTTCVPTEGSLITELRRISRERKESMSAWGQ